MPDLLASSYSLSEGSDGYALEETRFVEFSGPQGGQESALYDVLNSGGIPQRGDPHPHVPDIVVVSRDIEAMDNASQFKITIRYAIPSDGDLTPGVTSIRTGAGSASDQINIDLNGQPIRTTLEVGVTLPDGGSSTRTDEQVHNVDVERPSTSVEFEKVVSQNPINDAKFYVGRINVVTWYGGGRGTWLCTGIQGDSDDGGATYRTRYSFQFNPDGWNPTIRHRDPQTGLPFFGNLAFNPGAVITPDVYRYASFSGLGLTIGAGTG